MLSLVGVHQALGQLGYDLVEEQGALRRYQLRGHPDVVIIMDFHDAMTISDLTDILKSHSVEIVEPFFAMYQSL